MKLHLSRAAAALTLAERYGLPVFAGGDPAAPLTIDELVASLQAIIDGAKGRSLTDEEAARYEDLEGRLTAARRDHEIRSRQLAYTTPVGAPTVQTAANPDRDEQHQRAFEAYIRTGDVSGLAEYRAQAEATGAAGGFLVPTTMRNRLVERIVGYGGFAEQAETLNTTGGEPMEWPTVDDTANMGEIVAEGGTFASGADIVFGTATLGAYKYMAGGAGNAPLKVSWELLQDSAFDIEGLLARLLGDRIGRLQAIHWVTGDGTGEPLGLLAGKAAFDSIASNAAGPTYAELLATVHSIDRAYRRNAKWLMNDTTLALIQGQLDANDRPLWLPSSGGLADSPGEGTLLGYPVVIDDAMPDVGDATEPIAFGDFRAAYVIRRVKDVTIVRLNELYAANGQVGFMAWARASGSVQDVNAYSILGAQDTA